ncbi:MAG: 1-deoxy-D-xylulose-5-phosphate synthase [Deltaproteobacteria bacterium GWC2_42_11]|nr:MAG: 1-deoxy-D-xylulose-5-phosphate synthase [Deltaproteobacteria bacterium GWC2_42_11]HBO84638.1 1-deoxy-D-xylulose-5-phosphate synthase [Deltaproteobacteria bacterium]
MYQLLNKIDSPDDIKRLNHEELKVLAQELRQEIIKVVSMNGGHLASSLGAVELTIALHYVFNAPQDKIIWDVGHQSYSHKILTGRRDAFRTLRQFGGISGFPKPSESRYDAFIAGHSSTSISAALGISAARDIMHERYSVAAVIGDGSLTSGIAFEGLNQAGHLKKDMIVVLNDNEMSISKNVGALSTFLSRKLTGRFATRLKKEVESFFEYIPGIGKSLVHIAKKAEDSLITLLTPGMLFEGLGFHYIGPIDGHDMTQLISTLNDAKELNGPILIHVITKKGKGYPPAEEHPSLFHGVGPFDIETGRLKKAASTLPSYTDVFSEALIEIAEKNPKVVAITAAMPEGTGLDRFAKKFPERFFDVGIAEQHAITFAAGLASQGFIPVTAIYSTFLQRAYDQVLHDVCLQNLPVVFALDRAGIVGADGPTHHGVFDFSYLRHIPNIVVMAPKDEIELKTLLKTAVECGKPAVIRYPRGSGSGFEKTSDKDIGLGQAEVLREGSDLAIVAVGSTVYPCLEAAEKLAKDGILVTVVNARFVKPIDEGIIIAIAKKTGGILTVEENVLEGGFGSAVIELMERNNITNCRVKRIGVPDMFVEHGSQEELRRLLGLDSRGIEEAAKVLVSSF